MGERDASRASKLGFTLSDPRHGRVEPGAPRCDFKGGSLSEPGQAAGAPQAGLWARARWPPRPPRACALRTWLRAQYLVGGELVAEIPRTLGCTLEGAGKLRLQVARGWDWDLVDSDTDKSPWLDVPIWGTQAGSGRARVPPHDASLFPFLGWSSATQDNSKFCCFRLISPHP